MFNFVMMFLSAAWLVDHWREAAIAAAAIILLIVWFVRSRRQRRAAYLALPVQFIGNKATKTYHAGSCPKLSAILPENRIAFRLESETTNLGYKPCGICHPVWPNNNKGDSNAQ